MNQSIWGDNDFEKAIYEILNHDNSWHMAFKPQKKEPKFTAKISLISNFEISCALGNEYIL